MGLMWARVLLKQGPAAAAADDAQAAGQPATAASTASADITFIELPRVAGRNDCLTRDVFAAGRGIFGSQTQAGGLGLVAEPDNQAAIRRLAETLRLEAIGFGRKPQALINGKLLSHGDRFAIGEGKAKLECEVTTITESSVTLTCANVRITLRLGQTNVK